MRPDGRPFYIGKGSGKRLQQHRWVAKRPDLKGSQYPVYRAIRKMWEAGNDYEEQILLTGLTEAAAFEVERQCIAGIGPENLLNLTSGGEGISGYHHTDEAKTKISIVSRQLTPEQRQALSDRNRVWTPEELKARRRAAYAEWYKEKGPAWHRAWRQANRERQNEQQRQRRARARAKQEGQD